MTTSSHHSSSSSSRFSCPCQRIPLSLSSATSAEYGNVASLARRMKRNAEGVSSTTKATFPSTTTETGGGNSSTVPGGISNGGITPLHLAAQHGHPAAVSLLLKEGGCDVDTGLPITAAAVASNDASQNSGATPLHRAAFSGAISSMQILLSWGEENNDGKKKANLLSKDTSFGDKKTPLHKAVAGGRPLAVQLLMSALKQRQLLEEALQTKDASGLTPLELAKQFTSLGSDELEQERQSVRRWDVVAGGDIADWDTCQRLLEGATSTIPAATNDESLTKETPTQQPKLSGKTLPALTELDNVVNSYCDDGDECQDGKCRTAVWENVFRMALASSMEISLSSYAKPMNKTNLKNNGVDNYDALSNPHPDTTSPSAVEDDKSKVSNSSLSQKATATKMGRQCDSCGKHSPALFRSVNHQLVCRQCHRLGRRAN